MSNLCVRELKKDEFVLWDNFVDSSTNGHIFNKTSWTESYILTDQNTKSLIVGCFKDKELIAGANLCYTTKWKTFNLTVHLPSTPYNHIIIKERETKYVSKNTNLNIQVTQAIVHFLEKKFSYINLTYPQEVKDIRGLIFNKFTSSVLYTYTTKLNNLDSIYDIFDYSIKKRIKRGETLKYELVVGDSDQEIKEFLKLEDLTYKRQGENKKTSNTQTFNFLNKIRGKIKFLVYLIKYEQKPVAGRVELFDGKTVYDWKAGANPEYFDTGLNQIIIWEIIKDVKNKGMEYFNFGGANTESIASYKSKFNFQLTPYYSATKIVGFIPKLLFKIKEIIND